MKRLLPALAFVIMTLTVSGVSAHATPVYDEPDAASVLTNSPETIRIRFSERVEPRASSITVYAPDGSVVDTGAAVTDANDAHIFQTKISAKTQGTFAVSWQVISADDGHFTKGGYTFSVGTQTAGALQEAAGQFQISHRSNWPEAIAIWLEILGEAIFLGILMVTVFLWRPFGMSLSAEVFGFFAGRIRFLLSVGMGLILIGCISYFLLEGAALAADRGVSFSVSLRDFFSTVAGSFALTRLGVAALFFILWNVSQSEMLHAKRITSRMIFLFLLLFFIAMLRARVSHAAASHFLPALSILINAVHPPLPALWIGGLIAFVVTILPALDRAKKPEQTIRSLLSFSQLTNLAFACGGITGVYIVWLHLKAPLNLFTTHFGGELIALGEYAAVLLFLRVYQTIVVNRALTAQMSGRTTDNQKEVIRTAGPLLLLECFVGVATLLFSSILIITTPPLSPDHFFSLRSSSPAGSVTFAEHSYEKDNFLISVSPAGGPYKGSADDVTVTLENTSKGIGPIVAEPVKTFEGGFVLPKSDFSPPGDWTVRVSAKQQNAYDAVGTFSFKYPDDISAVHRFDETRTFGLFESIMAVTALIILAAALWLSVRTRALQLSPEHASKQTTELRIFNPAVLRLAIPIETIIVVLAIIALGGHNHGSGSFRNACAAFGGQWHENVPMRNGKVTSPFSVLGCMTGSGRGQFHIADEREFTYFTRKELALATLTTSPVSIVAGKPVTLTIALRDTAGNPVQELSFEHDRVLHAVIISQDFKTFQHVHVEDSGPVTPQMLASSTFPVRTVFPRAGRYLIAVDFTQRAQAFEQQFYVTVGKVSVMEEPNLATGSEQTFGGMNVRLSTPAILKAGSVQRISYNFTESGAPVTNLRPYLSAPMHLSAATSDLRAFIHTHGELPQTFLDAIFTPRDPDALHAHAFLPDRFGPDIAAYVMFPFPGQYVLFGEVNRDGKIVVTKFTVNVL